MTTKPQRSSGDALSRRGFLQGAVALSAAGAGLAGAAQARASTKGRAHASQADYDVIVVGGGFSGVTAARDCRKNGLRTLLLEAKSRLGGRTFDAQFRGHHIELGGTWVHWTQPTVWSEIMRYGLEVEETPGAHPDRVVLVAGTDRTAFETNARIEELVTGMSTYFAESGDVFDQPYDLKHCWKAMARCDAMTAADRFNAVKLSAFQRSFLVPVLEAMALAPVNEANYAEMLRWYALSLNNWATAVDALSRWSRTSSWEVRREPRAGSRTTWDFQPASRAPTSCGAARCRR